MKSIFDVILTEDTFQSIKREQSPVKERLLSFLKNGQKVSFAGHVTDLQDQSWTNIEKFDYESGGFYWDSSDIFHFEKYDLKLSDDFVEYVLNRPE